MRRAAPQVLSVADQVHRALRERILNGDLHHHERLHQEALALELGVSRTPLREALGRLAAEGLVELLPNRGARVADVRVEDMEAAYDARLVIEPAAAALAALHAQRVRMDALHHAIARHRAAGEDVGEAFDANRAFHLAVVAAAGNSYLLRFAEILWAGRVGMRVYEEQQAMHAFIAADADEHESIATAIGLGDARAAEDLMRSHIAAARNSLLGRLDQAGEPA